MQGERSDAGSLGPGSWVVKRKYSVSDRRTEGESKKYARNTGMGTKTQNGIKVATQGREKNSEEEQRPLGTQGS